jgi:serine/threonine protein kinase
MLVRIEAERVKREIADQQVSRAEADTQEHQRELERVEREIAGLNPEMAEPEAETSQQVEQLVTHLNGEAHEARQPALRRDISALLSLQRIQIYTTCTLERDPPVPLEASRLMSTVTKDYTVYERGKLQAGQKKSHFADSSCASKGTEALSRILRFPRTGFDVKLLHLVACGSFGAVYEACIVDDPGQKYAVKIPIPCKPNAFLAAEEDRSHVVHNMRVGTKHSKRERQLREFKYALQITQAAQANPAATGSGNVMQTYDVGIVVDGGKEFPLMLMEWSPGKQLLDACQEGRNRGSGPEEDLTLVRAYLRQLVEGLHFMHTTCGMIHRDLKLDQVMVVSEGQEVKVKITDFGFSKHIDTDSDPISAAGDTELQQGDKAAATEKRALDRHGGRGAPSFRAPEAISCSVGCTFDGKVADVWALGATLQTCLYIAYPFDHGAKYKFAQAHLWQGGRTTPRNPIDPTAEDLLGGACTHGPMATHAAPRITPACCYRACGASQLNRNVAMGRHDVLGPPKRARRGRLCRAADNGRGAASQVVGRREHCRHGAIASGAPRTDRRCRGPCSPL